MENPLLVFVAGAVMLLAGLTGMDGCVCESV